MKEVQLTESIRFINSDNMEVMANTPDNYYDLAIVDPEYGIGISNNPVRQKHAKKNWDSSIPKDIYFKELFRVAKNQIIWGGNYFNLPASQGFFIWDKKQPFDFSLAMCEFAWSSFQMPAKIFKQSVQIEKNKIHPTQKPIKLYQWLLQNYAKQGEKILDTHLGSASHAIAFHYWNEGKSTFDGIELDKEYFNASIERFNSHISKYPKEGQKEITTQQTNIFQSL